MSSTRIDRVLWGFQGGGGTRSSFLPPIFQRPISPIRLAVRGEALTVITKTKEKKSLMVIIPWRHADVKSRRDQTILTRLRIGHTRLTHRYVRRCWAILWRLPGFPDLLVECPGLGDLRERSLPRCRRKDGTFHISLILGERCVTSGHEVLFFYGGSWSFQ